MPELTNLCIISELDELETRMNDLNNEAKTRIAELKNMETLAKELGMAKAADIFSKQIGEIEKITDDIDDKLSKEIEDLRTKELIESKMKTVSEYTDDLKATHIAICGELKEIVEQRNRNKMRSMH
jgi:chaperonin cofactor prefoldin